MSEWKKVRLDQIGRVVGGAIPSTKNPTYYDGDISWITPKDLAVHKAVWIHKGERSITEEGLKSCSAQLLPKGTILFSSRAPIGYVAVAACELCTNQGFKSLIPNERLDSLFGYYLFVYNKERIENLGSGTTFKEVSGSTMRDVEVSLPPLPTQRKIAAVLGALDDKIENNRKICANLEAQAQAIFKSWFVDFEPFGGKMPQGWKMERLGDVAEITMGQSPEGKSLNENGDGITFFQGRAEFGDRYPTKRLSTTEPKRMAKEGDVLLSVRAPVGDLNIALDNCCIGRGLAAIRSKANCQSFIYCLLQSMKSQFDLYEGAGTIFGSINKDSLHGLSCLVPDEKVLQEFEGVVSSLDCMYRERELESRSLAAMRDALLPKLMSGEIDVEKVEVA